MKNQALEAARESIRIEAATVERMAPVVESTEFSEAVDVLADSSRIMTCASGSSGMAAKKFAHSLCCIERGAMFMPPAEAVHGGLGGLKKDDVMVMVSRGGMTTELLPIIDVCKRKGATLIAVTENIVLEKGVLSLGDFGFIYFIDWDQVRARKRVAEVLVMGGSVKNRMKE